MNTKRKKGIIIAAVAIVVGVGLALWLNRPLTPQEASKTAAEAFAAGDTHRLYALAPAWEKELLQLTPEQLEGIRQEVFLPIVQHIAWIGPSRTEYFAPGASAITTIPVRLTTGESFPINGEGVGTQGGANTPFTVQLMRLWLLEASIQGEVPQTNLQTLSAWSAGTQKHRATLEHYGVPGMVNSTRRDLVPFDVSLAHWETLRQKYEAQAREEARSASTP